MTATTTAAHIRTKNELGETFMRLRMQAIEATDRRGLEAVHRRARDLVDATRSPDAGSRFGAETDEACALAEREFARTVRALNERARALGAHLAFGERWEE